MADQVPPCPCCDCNCATNPFCPCRCPGIDQYCGLHITFPGVAFLPMLPCSSANIDPNQCSGGAYKLKSFSTGCKKRVWLWNDWLCNASGANQPVCVSECAMLPVHPLSPSQCPGAPCCDAPSYRCPVCDPLGLTGATGRCLATTPYIQLTCLDSYFMLQVGLTSGAGLTWTVGISPTSGTISCTPLELVFNSTPTVLGSGGYALRSPPYAVVTQ